MTEKEITLNDLKAKCYDCLVQIENWQKQLQAINKQIAEWKEPIEKNVETPKVEVGK